MLAGCCPSLPPPPHPAAGLPAPIPCTYFLKHFFFLANEILEYKIPFIFQTNGTVSDVPFGPRGLWKAGWDGGESQAECMCACGVWVHLSKVGPQAWRPPELLWVWPAPPQGYIGRAQLLGKGRTHSIVSSLLNFLSNHSSLASPSASGFFLFYM